MTSLPEFFKQTSDLSYERHDYKLIFKDGRTIVYDSWDPIPAMWFHNKNELKYVEVLDKKNKKSKKGF